MTAKIPDTTNMNTTTVPASKSTFDERTDTASSTQYFHYYGQLAQQQNMLQDLVRTGCYRNAMLENAKDFKDKIVLDVGAGTGMLSYFALQAGAKKVYAIEASNMAEGAKTLAKGNGYEDRLVVIKGRVEEVDVPELVDIIISEPMGILLVNEHMRSLQESAVKEAFATPVVDAFNPATLLCTETTSPSRYEIDFLTCTEEDLYEIRMPLRFKHDKPATVHGVAFWFDVVFAGSQKDVWLCTSPFSPLTHWYQVRCLFERPLLVGDEDLTEGEVIMKVNRRQSYDIFTSINTSMSTNGGTTGSYNLKDPFYRCSEYSSHDPMVTYDPSTGTGMRAAANIAFYEECEAE
eukprot:CFRG4505T1